MESRTVSPAFPPDRPSANGRADAPADPWRGRPFDRDLLASLPAAFYTCDAEGRVNFFNEAAVELWGRRPTLGQDLWCGSWRIFRPDGTPLPLERCPMAIALREARPVRDREIVVERPDGQRRHVLPHPQPLFDAEGRLVGAFNLLLDITAQKAADEVRNRLAAIVESSDDAIVSKDLNGIIMSWNGGAQRLFGYSAAEAIGQSITMLIPPERADEEPGVLERIRRGESIDHYETVRRRRDGTLIDISLTVSPLRDAQGRIIGASKIARDISGRKRAEQALQEADRRKDEFLATLAHELRNPLAPLASSLELLQLPGLPEAAATEAVAMMRRQVGHMVRLVDDLLEVSRITRGVIDLKREPLDLAVVLQEALEISRPLVEGAGHRLQMLLPPRPLTISGDRARLTQVIANLLNNAAKFTPPQGQIRLVLEQEDRQALLRVIDNGIGIPTDMLSGIFEMFTQVHGVRGAGEGGLGIGLSLVRRLATMHGGSIEARSEGPGRGSEFLLRLPLLHPFAQRDKPGSATVAASGAPRRRILVVDDNRDAAHSLGLLLRALGHEVELAHSGAEALLRATACQPELVLLDIGMPDIDGCEVAGRLRAQPWAQDTCLVALTGWGQEADRDRTRAAGFDHHLVKPVAYADLEKLLARHEPARPSRAEAS